MELVSAFGLTNKFLTPHVLSRSASWLPLSRAGACPSLYQRRNLVSRRSGKRSAQSKCQIRSRSLNMICRAQASTTTETVTIIGGGRVGAALKDMCKGSANLVQRGESVAEGTTGPIIVCTRNDDLQAVLDSTPKDRHEDLVFIQNGMLQPWLEEKGLSNNTQAVIYFAIAKMGATPIDGITKVNPEGLTVVTGKHAEAFASVLKSGGLSCKVVDKAEFQKAAMEKVIWICAMMLVGVKHDATVGEALENHTSEVSLLINELSKAASDALGITMDETLEEKLNAYTESVAHFPTKIAEFEWRNGWFYGLSKDATESGKEDPCPLHTLWLKEVGAI